MYTKLCVILVLVSLSASCRDEASVEPGEMPQQAWSSDDEVMRKVYDPGYSVPDGFYRDERAASVGSYTIYHVKDQSLSFELCSDDPEEAYAWETVDNANRDVNGEYVDFFENERYFEVIRDLAYDDGIGNISDPTTPGFSRVFKCSFVNRNGVDRMLRDGYGGRLNYAPLTSDAVADYVEYMWQFTYFWPARKFVLQSATNELENSFKHTLHLAFLTNQGNNACDLIEIVDWEFSVNKSSGEISRSFRLMYQFEAEYRNGSAAKCGP